MSAGKPETSEQLQLYTGNPCSNVSWKARNQRSNINFTPEIRVAMSAGKPETSGAASNCTTRNQWNNLNCTTGNQQSNFSCTTRNQQSNFNWTTRNQQSNIT
ncbi:hypothetical protein ABVT39_021400 [Epinephelus coioides]